MIAAGALLWTAAILDGADGILARAKGQASQFGRALDGAEIPHKGGRVIHNNAGGKP